MEAEGGRYSLGGNGSRPGLVDADGKPAGGLVQAIKMLNFPQFRFEYTPCVEADGSPGGKVIVAFLDKPKIDGQYQGAVLAEHCDTTGRATGFVQTFLRGYRLGRGGEIVAPIG